MLKTFQQFPSAHLINPRSDHCLLLQGHLVPLFLLTLPSIHTGHLSVSWTYWLLSCWVFICGFLCLEHCLCLILCLAGSFPSSDLKYYRFIYCKERPSHITDSIWPCTLYFIELIKICSYKFVYLMIFCLLLPPLTSWSPIRLGSWFCALHCILSTKLSFWCMMKVQCILVEWISEWMSEWMNEWRHNCLQQHQVEYEIHFWVISFKFQKKLLRQNSLAEISIPLFFSLCPDKMEFYLNLITT